MGDPISFFTKRNSDISVDQNVVPYDEIYIVEFFFQNSYFQFLVLNKIPSLNFKAYFCIAR